MRILVVTAMYPHPARPGQGAFVREQVHALRDLGVEVDVLRIPGYRNGIAYPLGMARVLHRTFAQRYDAVHAHFGLTGVASLLRWRTPLVVTFHGSDALGGGWMLLASRLAAAFAKRTIAVSEEIARRFPSEVIPCGIDLDRFRPGDGMVARASLGLRGEATYVLFPFHPERPEKRHALATAVVSRLRDTGVDAELLVVHDRPPEDMPTRYLAADVLLVPSRYEGSSTAIKEALACCLPIVSTAVGDAATLLDGLPSAKVVPANADRIAEAIAQVVRSPRASRIAGRQRVLAFSATATASRVRAVYQSVCRRE